MYILSISALTLFTLHYELSTVNDPWLSHCKSSWSCLDWWMSSKDLCVEQADVPHAAARWASTTWSDGSPLRDERYVKKLSNLLCLTRCGFYDPLEEGGSVCPNMGTQGRAHEPATVIFFQHRRCRTKPEKLLQCNSALSMLFSKRCLWSCMVGLIQLTKPARMVHLKGHGPFGCQGLKGFKGSLRGHGLKNLNVKGFKKFPRPRASGFQGIKSFRA